MTQRIFDVDNPQEIFDLFPDGVIRIEKSDRKDTKDIIIFDDDCWDYTHIKINWRDKTKITRPVGETQWIGKLCWFWTDNEKSATIGILGRKTPGGNYQEEKTNKCYPYCRPVRRDEVQFADDADTKE